MKYTYIFLFFLYLGCTPKIVQPIREQQVPVEIVTDINVIIDTTFTLPGVINKGDSRTILTDRDTTLQWDWGEVSTEVEITPKNEGREAEITVNTTQKPKTIFIRDTLQVTVTVRDTVTIKPDCPGSVPPPPEKGSGMLDWIWWAVAFIAAVVTGLMSRPRQNKTTGK